MPNSDPSIATNSLIGNGSPAGAGLQSGEPTTTSLGLITTRTSQHDVSLGRFNITASKTPQQPTVNVSLSFDGNGETLNAGPIDMDQLQNTEVSWSPDLQSPASIALVHHELAGQVFLLVGVVDNQPGMPQWTVGALDYDHETAVRKAWRHFLGLLAAGAQAIGDFIAWVTGR